MNKNLIIIPISENLIRLEKLLPELEVCGCDILIIYDFPDEDDEFKEFFSLYPEMKLIAFEHAAGIGALLMAGFDYARDYNYENILIHNCGSIGSISYIPSVIKNLDYGFDFVNCSRILENFNYRDVPKDIIEIMSVLSDSINSITGFDITDPISGIAGLKVSALQNMEFTEYNSAIFLQMWIQAAYYSLTFIEIPVETESDIGVELADFEDPLGTCLTVIETEKYLYKKGEMN